MELRHLRYFVAVAEEGSLTVAAERRMHTAQPSLSRQMHDLEYEVGRRPAPSRTTYPAAAIARATSKPMPLLAPVTSATGLRDGVIASYLLRNATRAGIT
jgi:hypothetical protein